MTIYVPSANTATVSFAFYTCRILDVVHGLGTIVSATTFLNRRE